MRLWALVIVLSAAGCVAETPIRGELLRATAEAATTALLVESGDVAIFHEVRDSSFGTEGPLRITVRADRDVPFLALVAFAREGDAYTWRIAATNVHGSDVSVDLDRGEWITWTVIHAEEPTGITIDEAGQVVTDPPVHAATTAVYRRESSVFEYAHNVTYASALELGSFNVESLSSEHLLGSKSLVFAAASFISNAGVGQTVTKWYYANNTSESRHVLASPALIQTDVAIGTVTGTSKLTWEAQSATVSSSVSYYHIASRLENAAWRFADHSFDERVPPGDSEVDPRAAVLSAASVGAS